jgi:superfamily II DNA or RNA helicase
MTVDPSFDVLESAAVVQNWSKISELSLARLMDRQTFQRAKQYTDIGAVVEVGLRESPLRLTGTVQGSRPAPYTCTALLSQRTSGMVTSLTGSCTCPVGSNCKHVVALALTAFREMRALRAAPERRLAALSAGGRTALRPVPAPAAPTAARPAAVEPTPIRRDRPQRPHNGKSGLALSPTRKATPEPARTPAPWERSIAALIGNRTAKANSVGPPIGLQIELISQPSSPSHRASAVPAPLVRVGLRPVLLGASGRWVRSGIAWDKLGSYGYQRERPRTDHVQLLREISAIHSASRLGGYSSYNGSFIFLDSLNSRRIWDLLNEAHIIGMALVQSGKGQRPVALLSGAGAVALDVGRVGGTLVIEPSIEVNGQPIGPANFALLGTPLHGFAFWPAVPGADPNSSGLTLVPTQQTLTPELRSFLEQGRVEIPQDGEETFIKDYLPRLARWVPMVSRDGSLEIPAPQPPELSLTVTGLPGHRVSLRWEWSYRIGDDATTVPLWPTGSESIPRNRDEEQAALESLSLPEADMARLAAPSHFGTRLVPALTLEGIDAARFFGETLPRLRGAPRLSLTVVNELSYREAVEAPVISISNSHHADDHDWFDLGITVTIEGEEVPFSELFVALAADEACMILPSGVYFPLDCEPFRTLRRLIDEARALDDIPGRTLKINRFQAALWDELQDLGVVTAQAESWKKSVGGLLAGDQIIDRPVPEALNATLRPYQQTGFNWLAFLFDHELGGVLADDMGLGKTVQTLALICYAREERPEGEPFLVVAPTSVVGNWAAESRKFAPDLRVVAVSETLARGGVPLAQMVEGADVMVTSYALFRLDFADYSDQDWAGLILDEAQFIKNNQSKGYQCAKKLATPFKLAITGTPMENNLLELWSMFSVTAPGLFSVSGRFKEYYQGPIERDGDSDRLGQLRRRIRPLMLRRTKEQVVTDLPEKQEQVIELELNSQHRKVYQRHLQRERQKVLGLIDDMTTNRFAIFRSLTLLRQLSLDASLVDPTYANIPSTKLDALMEQVADIAAEGHRTLIFSQFTGFLDKVRQRMDAAGVEYCYLDGSTRNRPAVLAQFRDGTAPVFLISLKAGGVGLTLTEADYCILLDPWWNPATEAQAIDRIHRIGQTRNVMVYRLVAKDTIEEKVMALKATKAKLFSSVMESGSATSTALTAADIRELLG